MKTYAGIDLHSSNCCLAVIDEQQRRLYSKRLPNSMDHILLALQPFKDGLSGVVVESTYNWYWLVDGLQSRGMGTLFHRCIKSGHIVMDSVHRPKTRVVNLRFGWNP